MLAGRGMIRSYSMEPPADPKKRKKSVTATLTTVPIELGNLTDGSTQIELKDDNKKPLGRFLMARTGVEFRKPFQKTKGVQKTWEALVKLFGD